MHVLLLIAALAGGSIALLALLAVVAMVLPWIVSGGR